MEKTEEAQGVQSEARAAECERIREKELVSLEKIYTDLNGTSEFDPRLICA